MRWSYTLFGMLMFSFLAIGGCGISSSEKFQLEQ